MFKLFLNTRGVTWPKNLRNIFQSLLIFYCFIKSESSVLIRIQKSSYVLMRHEPRFIFTLFLNFSDSEAQ